jgi:hypothetical protein
MAGTLPSTGPISASQIRNVGEGTGTPILTAGASYPVTSGSLVELWAPPESTVDQAPPHKFSEFRGKTWSAIVQITADIRFGNSPTSACEMSSGTVGTFYKNNGQPISYGDIMYTNLAGTNFAASGAYAYGTLTYVFPNFVYNEIFCVGSQGVITSLAPGNGGCSTGNCP